MKLSFVIPAYNEELYIGKCLDSVFRELKHTPCDCEIIVVNNASVDRTKEVASSFPGVKVVDEMTKGIVHARHAGFVASSGDLIANIDSDTVLTPGWISKVISEFDKDPKLVALSGPFIYHDAPKSVQRATGFFYRLGYAGYLMNRFVFRVGSMLQGGNFVIRRTAWEKAGGFDRSISFYGEDTDVARRLHPLGKVKFTFKLPMYASSRRLMNEGVFVMGLRYALNHFWMTFFKRPFSLRYTDIRVAQSGESLKYKPKYKAREFVIALASVLILIAVLSGMGLLVVYGVNAKEKPGYLTVTPLYQKFMNNEHIQTLRLKIQKFSDQLDRDQAD